MDEKPRFRNPDLYPLLSYREYMGKTLPKGKEGCVIEDIDIVFRFYGERYGLDDEGRFWIFEMKYGDKDMDKAQYRTFGLIDKELRESKRYGGFYLINYYDDDFEQSPYFKINKVKVSKEEMDEFLNWPDKRERMRF